MSLTDFHDHPGLYFVWATLLPLASFVFLLLASAVRAYVRRYQERDGEYVRPPRWPAFVATGAIAGAFVLCLIGAIIFFGEQGTHHHGGEHAEATEHAQTEGSRWDGSWNWVSLSIGGRALQLGYHIDHLSVIM